MSPLDDVENWPEMSKEDVAGRLIQRAAEHLYRTQDAAE